MTVTLPRIGKKCINSSVSASVRPNKIAVKLTQTIVGNQALSVNSSVPRPEAIDI